MYTSKVEKTREAALVAYYASYQPALAAAAAAMIMGNHKQSNKG